MTTAQRISQPHMLPVFLSSFEDLTTHFDEHFGPLGSNERGDTFLELAQKVISLVEEGQSFPEPRPSAKKSHDGGVDILTAQNSDGGLLCAQSKYKLRAKDEFDSVISKFKNYEASLCPQKAQTDLFLDKKDIPAAVPIFLIITSSKLSGIIERYEASSLASVAYYHQLRQKQRLVIIDGPRILTLLQQLYRKTHLIPSDVKLTSPPGWTQCGDVLLGAIRGSDLVALYELHGDALFFENIRDFLGTSSGKVVSTRSTVNQEIIKTISESPEKMLARNNGITLRADIFILESEKTVRMGVAAIVNGCQTTMALVHSAPLNHNCLVQVKVVQTNDAWDIAKAANYQNPVARVDLDLARYLRPQLVRRIAASLGYAVETNQTASASAMLNTIYRNKVDYSELKLLYLGMFSRRPNNLFEGNYAELRGDILEALYETPDAEEVIFAVLLTLLNESRRALEKCEQTYSSAEYASLFKRFYDDEKPRYRVYLATLAVSTLLRDDLSERDSNTQQELERMRKFLGRSRAELENQPDSYQHAYQLTFETIADSLLDLPSGKPESEIAQSMYNKISSTAFGSYYKKILIRLDGERSRARAQQQTAALTSM